jgi:hypothetical protein
MSGPTAHHSLLGLAQTRRSLLQHRAQTFCTAFTDLPNNPPAKILSEHFTTENPRITEHGPSWANTLLPFLGKTFCGIEGCKEYFALLAQTLEFIPLQDSFPRSKEGFIVDDCAEVGTADAGVGKGWDGRGAVVIVGKGKFKAVKTEKEWEERFIYRLSEFDEDGRIGHWEIWADPLSAWVAVGGGNTPK